MAKTQIGHTIEGLSLLRSLGQGEFVDEMVDVLKNANKKSKEIEKYEETLKYLTPEEQYQFIVSL